MLLIWGNQTVTTRIGVEAFERSLIIVAIQVLSYPCAEGLEDAGVFAAPTEKDEFHPALIPWIVAHCLSGPAADQISWLDDNTEDMIMI